jgi:hypothetical protein
LKKQGEEPRAEDYEQLAKILQVHHSLF